MRTVARAFVVALALAAAVASPGCRRFRQQVTYVPLTTVRTVKDLAPEIRKLGVDLRSGSVRVIGDSPDALRIEAEVRIREARAVTSPDPGAFDDHVVIAADGETLTIADAHDGTADEDDWQLHLVIHVPPRLAARVEVGAGLIEVRDTTADIRAATGAGRIAIHTGTARNIHARTGAGQIEIHAARIDGTVDAEATTGQVGLALADVLATSEIVLKSSVGDVWLDIPAGTTGTFDLRTAVGAILTGEHQGIRVERAITGASATARVGEGGPRCHMETSTGAIRLK